MGDKIKTGNENTSFLFETPGNANEKVNLAFVGIIEMLFVNQPFQTNILPFISYIFYIK